MPGRILLGVASGALAALLCLLLAYVVGVVVVAVSLGEFLPTLFTAVTVLPLLLIIVGGPLSLVVGLLVGGLLGSGASSWGRVVSLLIGVGAGFICAELVLTLMLPFLAPPRPGDFIYIISNPWLSGGYGVVLGAVTALLFRWINGRGQRAA